MLKRLHQRIQEKADDARAPVVLIAALGDSVTQGCTALEVLEPETVYHHRLKRLLEQEYSQSTFSVLNAGVAGDNAPGGLARLERDVLRHQPDLVLVAFGLNDAGARSEGMSRFRTALELIVLRTREYSGADVVLVTPNFMLTRDNDNVAATHRAQGYVEKLMKVQNEGWVGEYAEAIRELGGRLEVPIADVYAVWQRWAEQGADVTAMLSNGLNHPSGAAHQIPAELIMQIIDPAYQPRFESLMY